MTFHIIEDHINPPHYSDNNVECIEFTRLMNFQLGNAFKYIWRHHRKNGIEDLKKAEWYLLDWEKNDYCVLDLDTDVYLDLLEKLESCRFAALQKQALVLILALCHIDSGKEMPKILECLLLMIDSYQGAGGG